MTNLLNGITISEASAIGYCDHKATNLQCQLLLVIHGNLQFDAGSDWSIAY